VHREYDPFGIDVVPTDEALAVLADTCALVKRLWTEEKPFDFDGRGHRLSGIRSVQVFFTAQEPSLGTARHPGPAAARELLAELIDAGARHCVLACIGLPSAQWVAQEIIRPVRAMTGYDGR
jgi:alkanesulfonate monooxygenase SsuD/methylene tetrahydromethanopterin reductase-like flavin-dependent oxidoreductase (luciferase family)